MDFVTKTITPGGESVSRFFNPLNIFIHLWKYRSLIKQLTWRDVVSRYKGTFIGIGWSVIQPLIMLCVYTFVFAIVFKAKWGVDPEEGKGAFGLVLFMGLTTFSLFSEVVNAVPSMMLANTNYVKKVIFPLEVLPLVRLLSALINALFSLAIILLGVLVLNHRLPWTVFMLPLVWLPMMFFSLGLGYFLASVGVFVRDLDAMISMVTTMLLFLSPIFYPVSAVPSQLRIFYRINPIAIFIDDARRVVLWGLMPDWPWLLCGQVLAVLVWVFGFVWFMKSKKAFADVM